MRPILGHEIAQRWWARFDGSSRPQGSHEDGSATKWPHIPRDARRQLHVDRQRVVEGTLTKSCPETAPSIVSTSYSEPPVTGRSQSASASADLAHGDHTTLMHAARAYDGAHLNLPGPAH
jgi:hypothetical protein